MTDPSDAQTPSLDSELEGMKIALVLRDDLPVWQKLNVASFTISGVASQPGAVGALQVVGMAFRTGKKTADKIMKGLKLHA
jgi:hypothetical protein